jgi:glucose-1-phosphate thymidylyltransferase
MEVRGVILAGGTGSRLFPLTKVCNKHLLPVYNVPMIYYPIKMLKSAGIKEILVITGTSHAGDIFSHLGSGKDFDVNFTYRIQDFAGGIPSAISLAEDFVGNNKFISINGDNIIFESLKPFTEEFKSGNAEMQIMLFEGTKEEARKSGVAVMEGINVVDLIEKPPEPPNNNIVVGIYFMSPCVFEIIRNVKPSGRGETEITDVQKEYLKRGALEAKKLTGKWLDAGDFEDLLHANQETNNILMLEKDNEL